MTLDQDGPAPDDADPPKQPNELHLSPLQEGGGRVRGTLNAWAFEALMTAFTGLVKPPKRGDDDPRTLAERRGDALGEMAMFAMSHDPNMSSVGGARPHLSIILTLNQLIDGVSAATLPFGGELSAAHYRALACDCGILPIVMGGNSEPLDIGRSSRVIPWAMRKAVEARDRGCAFPGPANW